MEDIQKVKLGDVISLDEKSMKIIDDLLKPVYTLEISAHRLLGKVEDENKEAFNRIRKIWPFLNGFEFIINRKNMHISIVGKH